MTPLYDIAIIGGGVNGAGIARDAAGRGLKVLLCEKGDLGGATSSASTKLIHGGLRYLEHYDFKLVRHALGERERLWGIAPHIVWPLRFVLPHRKGLRPAWLLRLGLLLYDYLGGRKLLPPAKTLRLSRHVAGQPLRDNTTLGFEYSDCWVQDNRLVVLNARDAAMRGSDIRVRTTCTAARRSGDHWELTLDEKDGAEPQSVRSKVLVNAAGPWVDDVLNRVAGRKGPNSVRLVQGSHIIVPRLYEHDRCYVFQNPDKRIIFAIPYEDDFTLIGTTDRDYKGRAEDVAATTEEIDYLCAAASSYFKGAIKPAHVVWTYSGVRPLYNDGSTNAQETTRDYVLTLDTVGGAPLLSVFGGKITTYRCLAEDVLDKLAALHPNWAKDAGWTGRTALPGGDFARDGAAALAMELRHRYRFVDDRFARHLVRHYGTETDLILGQARSLSDLGRDFGGGLTEAEVRHLIQREFASTAADVVWRRTKYGLRMSAGEIAELDRWMTDCTGCQSATTSKEILHQEQSRAMS